MLHTNTPKDKKDYLVVGVCPNFLVLALSERDLSFQAISNLSIPVERMYFLYLYNNNNNKERQYVPKISTNAGPPKTKYLGQKKT